MPNTAYRVVVLALVGVGAGVALCLVALRPLGLDPFALFGTVSDVERGLADTRALEERDAPLRARLEAKRKVARALVDGRLDLLEAGARFRDLNRADPSFDWDHFRQYDPRAASDDERHCRAASIVAADIVAAERGEEEGGLAARRFEG